MPLLSNVAVFIRVTAYRPQVNAADYLLGSTTNVLPFYNYAQAVAPTAAITGTRSKPRPLITSI